MRKAAVLIVALALFMSSGVALEAVINPASPDEIVLDSSNDYQIFKVFDGSGSTGDSLTYTWNNVDSTETDSGVEGNFSFDRDSSQSNTVRLTVTNNTHSDVDEVTQVVRDVPNTTISTDTTSITTSETASLTASVTNAFDDPVSYAWKVNGNNQSAGDSFAFSSSSSGDYDITLTVTDQAGNNGTSNTVTVSVTSEDTDDGGDSGGGGGGFTGDLDPGPPEHVQAFNEITPESPAVVSVDQDKQEALGIRQISIMVSNPANDVSITVSKQDGEPADVSVSVEGTAYRYMDIRADNLNDTTTDQATIQFDVNESWVNDNDINVSSVRLERYTNDSWQDLPTDLVDQAGQKYVFNATTPGFSYFAVAADENDQQTADTNETSGPVCGDAICSENETWADCPSDCPKPDQVIAEEAIDNASSIISEGTVGYSTLQQAEDAYDQGNYQQAADLAEQAWTEYMGAQDDEKTGTPVLTILILLTLAVIVGGVVYKKRDQISDILDDQRNRQSRTTQDSTNGGLGEPFVEADQE